MSALLYLDSSALVKLVLPEPETDSLLETLSEWPQRVASEIAAVEVRRAARRATEEPAVHQRADQVVAGVHLLRLSPAVLEQAAELGPAGLRTSDAVHLVSALGVADDLGAFVAYDRTLLEAARGAGLDVLSPGLGG